MDIPLRQNGRWIEEKYAKYGVSCGRDESRIWKYRGKRPGMDGPIEYIW